MSPTLHMIKLCVGCDSVEALLAWRTSIARPGEPWILRTRQTPKRAGELEAGGSLYRVYRGVILSRQQILAVKTVAEGPLARCEITLHEEVVPTVPSPRRPFQGWRYLAAHEAPADLAATPEAATLPRDLMRRLLDAGAW